MVLHKNGSSKARRSVSHTLRQLLSKQPKAACFDDVASIARKLYTDINTSVSLSLLQALNSGDIDYIAKATVSPKDYDSADSFFVDYAAVSFLRKYEDLASLGKSSLDPQKAAVEAFFQAEKQCLQTNERLLAYQEGHLPVPSLIAHALHEARRVLLMVLPRVPSLKDVEISFGPGSTSECVGEFVTIADKLNAFPTLTWGSRHLVDVVKNSPWWFNHLAAMHPAFVRDPIWQIDDFGNSYLSELSKCAPRLVRGNRFFCVPKDATKHRGACIEPHLLTLFQRDAGRRLTWSLDRLGLNKESRPKYNGFGSEYTQPDKNGWAARRASLTGELATIDLSAASDTISYELVKFLLPTAWFDYLSSIRSEETLIEGQWVELEKFSSMGNGFTFELETLIFYALVRGVYSAVGINPEPQEIGVFGDDIVCSSAIVPQLLEVFSFAGFTINEKKTFFDSHFNESCGQDFFKGIDVRPFFLKRSPKLATDWFAIANGIRRMGLKHHNSGVFDPRFLGTWLRVISRIPKQLRFHGPEGYGDFVIQDSDRSRWTAKSSHGIVRVKGLSPVSYIRPSERYCVETQHLALLYGSSSEGFALRGDPLRCRPQWLSVIC